MLLSYLAAIGSAIAAPIVVPAYRMPAPPVIDGVIHEDTEWKDVPSISGLVDENTNEKASDAATFWLAYDGSFLYFAARMADTQPSLIRATQYQTNVSLQGDDYLQIDVDLSGSTNDFSLFQVNPRGATNIQLTGGRAFKREWAGEFQAAARITATGWEAEMRIPWQVMALPGAGPRDVRVNFERFIARANRSFAVAYVNSGTAVNTPIWRGVTVPKAALDRSIKMLPYGYAGFDPKIGGIFNSGLDLKTSLADQVQLVGSIEPDFRNIENQILSLDFSRFQRIANESRPFFLEGSQYVGSALFASQLVPDFDVGVNSYGKLTDKTSFGVLDTTVLKGQNDLVANVTHAPNANTNYRFGVTSQEGLGVRNEAYLARYQQVWGNWGTFVRDMQSWDGKVGWGDNADVQGFYIGSGLAGFAEYSRVTPNFLPRLGFFPEVDYQGYDGILSYDRPWNHGVWNDVGGSFSYLVYQHANGSDYRRDADYQLSGTLRNGLHASFEQDLPQFEGSNDHLSTVNVSYPRGNPYDQVSTTYAFGREAGSAYDSLTLSTNRRLFNRLQLIGSYQEVHYNGFVDQAILDANCDLRKDMAVYGRLVKQGSSLNGYIAFRRSGNLGAEYYLIVGDPNALTFRPSIILKVVIPFNVGSGHQSRKDRA